MNKSDTTHSFVHNIRIASPCSADWNKMSGDERKRYCGQCRLHVYNISDMNLQEAEALIQGDSGNRLCVQLYRRPDGTVLTRDCPVGVWRIKRKIFSACSIVASLMCTAVVWLASRLPDQSSSPPRRANLAADKFKQLVKAASQIKDDLRYADVRGRMVYTPTKETTQVRSSR